MYNYMFDHIQRSYIPSSTEIKSIKIFLKLPKREHLKRLDSAFRLGPLKHQASLIYSDTPTCPRAACTFGNDFYKIKAGVKATRRGNGASKRPKRTTKRGLATKRTPPESTQKHCTKQRHSPTKERGQPHEEHETKRTRHPKDERGPEEPSPIPRGSGSRPVLHVPFPCQRPLHVGPAALPRRPSFRPR